jgi:hypothetical protein
MSYAAGSGPTGPGLVALIVLLALLIGLSVAVGCILLSRDGQPGRRVRRSTGQRRLDEQFARGRSTRRSTCGCPPNSQKSGPTAAKGVRQ